MSAGMGLAQELAGAERARIARLAVLLIALLVLAANCADPSVVHAADRGTMPCAGGWSRCSVGVAAAPGGFLSGVQPLTVNSGDGPAPGTNPSPPMAYHDGAVLHSLTVHPILWEPAGETYPSGQYGYLDQFLKDAAASIASGSASIFRVAQEYADTQGPALQSMTVASPVTDSAPYPASACAATQSQPTCLTDAQVQAELDNDGARGGGSGDVYVLVLPVDVNVCGVEGSCLVNGVDVHLCAYHSPLGAPGGVHYMVIGSYGVVGCSADAGPSSATAGDNVTGEASHELLEVATDPDGGGWYDANGNEISDLCITLPGPTTIDSTGYVFNQSLAGDHYLVQEAWSDPQGGCSQASSTSYGPAPGSPSITVTNPTNPESPNEGYPEPNQPAVFSATLNPSSRGAFTSWSWSFGDGSSASTQVATHTFTTPGTMSVTVTAMDAAGFAYWSGFHVPVVAGPSVAGPSPTHFIADRVVTLQTSATSSAGPVLYYWKVGSGPPIRTPAPRLSYLFMSAGTFPLAVSAIDPHGQWQTATATVTVAPAQPRFSIGRLRHGSVAIKGLGLPPGPARIRLIFRRRRELIRIRVSPRGTFRKVVKAGKRPRAVKLVLR